MYRIYIDTSDRFNKIVRLLKLPSETSKTEDVVMEQVGDFDVVSAIQEMLDEAGITTNDLDSITPFLGPGSFTGLKMGVTVANVFNWTKGKKNVLYPDYGREPNITPRKEK